MKHTYHIEGMTCSGCENKVTTDLSQVEHITEVAVSKEQKLATLTMSKHVEIDVLQQALGGKDSKYQISIPNSAVDQVTPKSCCSTNNKEHKHQEETYKIKAGKFYCPMHCEGDKVYDKAGDCPVCGMDLVQQPTFVQKPE